jgi:hypothetical protein
MEYFDPVRNAGIVFAFRGSIENQDRQIFLLKGVRPGKEYQLHFQDQSSPDKKVLGRDLLEKGLSVALPVPKSSELVFIKEIAP